MALKMKTGAVHDKNTNTIMSDCKVGHDTKKFLECNVYKMKSPLSGYNEIMTFEAKCGEYEIEDCVFNRTVEYRNSLVMRIIHSKWMKSFVNLNVSHYL